MLRGFLPRAAGLAVVAALTLTAVTGTVAQDAPAPEAAPEAAPAPVQHPADIRLGSCAALGDVVAPLNAAIAPTGDPQGQAGATPVEQSVTEIPVALSDLLATGHAIAVHPSPEQMGTPIACGEIGGAVGDDGALAVGLTAANGSKVSGTASLAPIIESGGTVVSLFVVDERAGRRGGGGGAEATGEPAVGGGSENETAATDNASGDNGAGPAAAPKPASAPAPAPATEPATAGLDGVSTISASNEDGKNAKPARNRDRSKADRDANGNAGNATTNSDTKTNSGNGERGNREGRARAGEDG